MIKFAEVPFINGFAADMQDWIDDLEDPSNAESPVYDIVFAPLANNSFCFTYKQNDI